MSNDPEKINEQNTKEMRERELISMFQIGKIKFELVSTNLDWSSQTKENLLRFKAILQKQLPKMPKEYILKQIFNEKHHNIICLLNDVIIGGVCYRPFYDQSFVEVVFLAVEADVQVTGHGTMIIDVLKEHIKREIQNLNVDFKEYLDFPKRLKHPIYIMAYADNYAIGFFKKQGFGTEIYFKNWIGYIKDYEGGTLVQCKVLWEINYLTKLEFIEKKRLEFINKMSKVSSFNVLHDALDFSKIHEISDIPGLKEAKFTDDMLITTTKKLKNVFRYILSDIRTDTHAWPFILPVNEQEVPDYYQIIKFPMDLSTIEKNIENDKYQRLDEFESDFRRIFKNCYTYNAPSTTYCKCAHVLEKRFNEKLNEVRHVFEDEKITKTDRNMEIVLPGLSRNFKQATDSNISKSKSRQSPPIVFFKSDESNFNKKTNKSINTQNQHNMHFQNSLHEKKEEKVESEDEDIFKIDLMDNNSGNFF